MNSSSLDSKNDCQRLDQQNRQQNDNQQLHRANSSAVASILSQHSSNSSSKFPSSLCDEDHIPQDLRPYFVPRSDDTSMLRCARPVCEYRLDIGVAGYVSPAFCGGQIVARKDDRDLGSQAVEAEARIFITLILPSNPKFTDLSSHIVDFRGVTVVPPATTPPQFSMLLERGDIDLSRIVKAAAFDRTEFPHLPKKLFGVDVDPKKREISIGNNFPLILDFALQVAKGLKYLHVVKKVVHHDLQESNVLVFFRHSEDRFHLKLCDFGSALRVGAKIPSPPQDSSRRHDHKSSPCLYEHASPSFDVYSFGVVLQHLMPSDISPQQTALERGLRDLQRKCLNNNPAERPKDGGVLVQALRRLSGENDNDPLESCPSAYETHHEVDEAIDECNEPILPQPETDFTLLSSFRPSKCTPPEYFATLWEANRKPSTSSSTLDPAIASLWSKRKYAGKYRSIVLPESDEHNQVNVGYSAHSASSLWSVSGSITDPQDVRFQFLVEQANSSSAESPSSQKRIFVEEVKLLRSPFATRFFLGVHDHFPRMSIHEAVRGPITGWPHTASCGATFRLERLIESLSVNAGKTNNVDFWDWKCDRKVRRAALIFGWQVLSCNEVNDVLKYGPSVNFSSNYIFNARMDASFFLDAQSALQHAGDRSGCLVLFLISVCRTRFDSDNGSKNIWTCECDEVDKYDSSMNVDNETVIFMNNRLRALPVAVCQGVSLRMEPASTPHREVLVSVDNAERSTTIPQQQRSPDRNPDHLQTCIDDDDCCHHSATKDV